jgi:hypothetical protein
MKQKFYTVKVEFLIEAKDKETARKMVVDHNFAKVKEDGNGWCNFEAEQAKRIKDSEVV